MNLRSR